MPVPKEIRSHSNTELVLVWEGGEKYLIPYFQLRFFCPCATCVDEMSGKRVLKKTDIREDVKPVKVETVGNYAVQIEWTDGHKTGLYHYDRLYDLCRKIGLPTTIGTNTNIPVLQKGEQASPDDDGDEGSPRARAK